ncbi:hypothetical protein [Pyxidicoccus trucidator]|uniref:hypothetical protein n=1 Tax=Pyxidicoccus trucidator TaxID=2709662 RepID=UPI0013DC8E7F|nr:hypothetical protein [Pyxidicoccus trucidator]
MKKIAWKSGLFMVLAGSAAYAGAWSGSTTISTIEAEDTGSGSRVYLKFSSEPFVSHSCANKSGYYRLGGSAENIRMVTSLAVSAKLASRPVRVFWNIECSEGGTSGYPVMSGIELL